MVQAVSLGAEPEPVAAVHRSRLEQDGGLPPCRFRGKFDVGLMIRPAGIDAVDKPVADDDKISLMVFLLQNNGRPSLGAIRDCKSISFHFSGGQVQRNKNFTAGEPE